LSTLSSDRNVSWETTKIRERDLLCNAASCASRWMELGLRPSQDMLRTLCIELLQSKLEDEY